ncbi:MAG TPA: hypothetical protein VKA30_12760, partial [Actinomycetota bacterium]|nr:hypothetical protein [Actinomycetota bacterium]
MSRIPLRLRLTLAFAAGMAVVLAALALVLSARFKADLTNGVDQDLRSRAQVVMTSIARQDPSIVAAGGNLIDPDEAFAQVLDARGRVVDSSQAVAGAPMVGLAALRAATHGPWFASTHVRGVEDEVRLMVVAGPTVHGERLF